MGQTWVINDPRVALDQFFCDTLAVLPSRFDVVHGGENDSDINHTKVDTTQQGYCTLYPVDLQYVLQNWPEDTVPWYLGGAQQWRMPCITFKSSLGACRVCRYVSLLLPRVFSSSQPTVTLAPCTVEDHDGALHSFVYC